jgi:poly-gamma-glutamate synthesis protein (capsule biosynthesis protein)
MDRNVKIAVLISAGAIFLAILAFYFLPGQSFTIGVGQDRDVEQPETIVPDEKSDGKVTLAAVGDMMLSRVVEQKMIARNDWKYPFLETAETTSKADLTFGNLETTIYPGQTIQSGSFTFRTDPKALAGLELAGFDVLSLANNHTMNFGYAGMKSTVENLDAAGINHIGAGIGSDAIYAPVIKEAEGTKFGFLAYTYARDEQYHEGEMFGTAYADTPTMETQVGELKKSADVVIVSMHMGTEYATEPHITQTRFARAAIDAGATLVIGHHPHVVETAEKYKDGYIIYSLGNFVFDQMWSEETRLGAIAMISFDRSDITGITFTPVKIYDYAQPQILAGEQAEMILRRLEMEEG